MQTQIHIYLRTYIIITYYATSPDALPNQNRHWTEEITKVRGGAAKDTPVQHEGAFSRDNIVTFRDSFSSLSHISANSEIVVTTGQRAGL